MSGWRGIRSAGGGVAAQCGVCGTSPIDAKRMSSQNGIIIGPLISGGRGGVACGNGAMAERYAHNKVVGVADLRYHLISKRKRLMLDLLLSSGISMIAYRRRSLSKR